MRLYAITARLLLPGAHQAGSLTAEERHVLTAAARDWAADGVEFVQVREKDLPPAALLQLTQELARSIRGTGSRLLVNGPPEVAVAADAAGVHLPGKWSGDAVLAARAAFRRLGRDPIVSVSCHTQEECRLAVKAGVDAVLFGPVFGKALLSAAEDTPARALAGVGLGALAEACRAAAPTAVFALGGVTARNAGSCIEAGAAGIAAIRLFQGPHWRQLRG